MCERKWMKLWRQWREEEKQTQTVGKSSPSVLIQSTAQSRVCVCVRERAREREDKCVLKRCARRTLYLFLCVFSWVKVCVFRCWKHTWLLILRPIIAKNIHHGLVRSQCPHFKFPNYVFIVIILTVFRLLFQDDHLIQRFSLPSHRTERKWTQEPQVSTLLRHEVKLN